ncbi:hypothetical protein KDW_42640 [Dictyobacter vulcani]|uniref:Dipeptidylpeptidase IV N-terminal domain-containing protein n=1 Tax=Dictyobacter vulcani TaxID=2607529 RepID=A0A5J4KSJ5_9CHLR|nr:PD40 domain-containing protein [Dictyobacter vulcani]GER90102.1 hypothetical protein KDW_42640 [Dictyobacter vulcani]
MSIFSRNHAQSGMHTSLQTQAITPETVFSVRTASNARISPDGKKIAFQVGEWLPGEEKYRKRLWITDASSNEPEPFTRGIRQDGVAAWSPDGHTIAFASKLEGEKGGSHFQLFVKDVQTGDEHLICTLPNGISNVSWSPDGKRIAFCSVEGEPPLQDPQVQYYGIGRHTRLWTVRRDYDIAEPVTPNGLTVWHYTWSPDSSRFAVYYTTGPEETDWYRGQIGLVAAHGGRFIRSVNLRVRRSRLPGRQMEHDWRMFQVSGAIPIAAVAISIYTH